MNITRRKIWAVAAALLLCNGAALAQSFPARAITVIVPFPPGGPADSMARLIGQKMSDSVRQPVIVENRPGGGGQIAAAALLRAPADGYTLFLSDMSALTSNHVLYKSFSFDPLKDFQPITPVLNMPMMLLVPGTSSADSVPALLALAASKPEGLSFASQGPGTGGHLLGELFRTASGAKMVHVPYKGSAPAVADVLSGRVDFLFDGVPAGLPHLRAGKMKILAAATPKRATALPSIPTMADSGYPVVNMYVWFGFVARAGTPSAIVQKLNDEITSAVRIPEVTKRFEELGFEISTMTPEQAVAFTRDESARWIKVIRDHKIIIE